MENSRKLTALLAVVLTLCLTTCKKEGPEGPVGPVGPQGEQGIAGDQGAKGDKGDTGTANVIYSDWLGADFQTGIVSYIATFEAPEITEEILNSGDIAVYMREATASGFTYTKLNYSFSAAGTSVFITATPKVGELLISASFQPDAPDYGFRYVIIPGGTAASAFSRPDMDLENYGQVARAFDIPD